MSSEASFFNATTIEDSEDLMEIPQDESYNFDPVVFWCVNAFIFIMLATVLLWCCSGKANCLISGEAYVDSDAIYQQTLREREEKKKKAKIDTPAKRRAKLLKSFRRHKVQMVSYFILNSIFYNREMGDDGRRVRQKFHCCWLLLSY